jgi:4-amino-4-deoxy-L-arabinose transferase-like glycosyltransferase
MNEKTHLSKYDLYLYLLVGFHVLAYFLFRFLDKSYQTWDSAGHLGLSMRFSDSISTFLSGDGGVTGLDLLKLSNYYPPIFFFFTSFFNLIFGYSTSLLLFLVLLVFIGNLFLIYGIVQRLGYDKKVAFLSVLFFSLFALVADQARLFHLEHPLILVLLLCYYILLMSDGLLSIKKVVLFFLCFGIAQLIKWYAFVFLVIPVLVVLVRGVRYRRWQRLFLNIAIGSLVLVLVVAPWYLANLEDLLHFMRLFAVGESDDPQVLMSFTNVFFYLRNILSHQIYLVPFVVSWLGFFRYVKLNKTKGLVLFVHMLFVYSVFTFISNKNLRYVLPLTPIFAFLISYFLTTLRSRISSVALMLLVILYVFFGFLFSTFNQVKAQSSPAKFSGVVLGGPFYVGIYNAPQMYSYDVRYVPIKEILFYVVEDAKANEIEPIGITPLIDAEELSVASLEMVRLENRIKTVYFPVPYLQFEPFASTREILRFFADANVSYVLVPEYVGPSGLRNYAALSQVVDFMNSDDNIWFEPIKTFGGFDNNITVFRRIETYVDLPMNSCQEVYGYPGEIRLNMEAGATYVIFTGHFSTEYASRDFEESVLRVLEIGNNDKMAHPFVVSKLPLDGVSVCYREGIDLDLGEEIGLALTSKTSCGNIGCNKVVHTRVMLDGSVEEFSYTKEAGEAHGL